MLDAPWRCPACQVEVTTRFCARCGEEPVSPRDLTLRGIAGRLVHAFTSIDARTARSAWKLVRHPGELTRVWVAGIRKPYVSPFQLFLVANAVFFAIQWATGENVFSSSLESHLHHQDWSEVARSALSRHLAETRMPIEQYAPIFDRAVVLNAKSLIVLMTVPFGLLLPLVFLRARRPFMTHVVFSLHLYTFLLLLFCVALLIAKLCAMLGLGGLESAPVDNVLSVANLLACALYLYVAIGPVYGSAGVSRVAQTLALVLAVSAIVLGYRFALFFITLYGT
jgi:hypothetical protein